MERLATELQGEALAEVDLYNTIVKCRAHEAGAREKGAPGDRPFTEPAPGLNGGFTWKLHVVAVGELGQEPVAPPKSNRRRPWTSDAQRCSRRNEIERLFGRLKGFSRIATHYEILDVVFHSEVLPGAHLRPAVFDVERP